MTLTPQFADKLRSTLTRGHVKMFVQEPQPVDPFDKALADLNEWDRQCREAHDQHMADLAELQQAIRSV